MKARDVYEKSHYGLAPTSGRAVAAEGKVFGTSALAHASRAYTITEASLNIHEATEV